MRPSGAGAGAPPEVAGGDAGEADAAYQGFGGPSWGFLCQPGGKWGKLVKISESVLVWGSAVDGYLQYVALHKW